MKIIILILALSATSCAQIGQAVGVGAQANDEALSSAEFVICNAASVGSVKRRYNTQERVDTWQKLCNDQSKFTPEGGSN